MTTYSKAGSFAWAGGGKSGAIVDLWATSRFTGPPAENQAPPSGSPDAGPVTTGADFGNPGAYVITGIATLEDYYVRVQYGGNTYWGACPAGTLGGAGSGGDGWPAVDGTGAGNLTAETPDDDTVGYSFTDRGSGGITLQEEGSGGLNLANSGDGGTNIQDESTTGLVVTTANHGPLLIQDASDGGVTVESNGGQVQIKTTGAGDGITVSAGTLDTGGVTIASDGTGAGSGIDITTTGAIPGAGVTIIDSASDVGISIEEGGVNNGHLLLSIGAGTGVLSIVNSGTGGVAVDGGSGGITLSTASTVAITGALSVSGHVGFFGTTPIAKPAITGALSTVTDAAAKAVLTSIITQLAALGLITNSTT